jgi:murein DD-endopeptidase MepM/ murein hydrolase activator NlpD
MAVRYFPGKVPLVLLLSGGILLTGCGDFSLDDLRNKIDPVPGINAAATKPRPKPDKRGVITYPHYQVIIAQHGDSMTSIAERVGMDGADLARYNGLSVEYKPRLGEVLALPKGIIIPTEEENPNTGSIEEIASAAIGRTDNTMPQTGIIQPGPEPIQHVVEPGETAYSIARLYNVSVTSLASWNGLDRDLSVRSGQRLLIPVVDDGTPVSAGSIAEEPLPGEGSQTPIPPTASQPLPDKVEEAVIPESPDLGATRTPPGASRKLLKPVNGKVLRGYSSAAGGNEGLDIGAAAGTPVKAAEDGEVALISNSANGTIILLRHPDNLYTVYSNVENPAVRKGQTIRRGQTIAKVAKGDTPFVHFEIRRGTESVDPAPYL